MDKNCKNCAQTFAITDEDLKFYDRVSPVFGNKKYELLPPTLCPDCRQQRRLAFRNENKLYHRKCDLCGKEIISVFSSDKKNKIYCSACWSGDSWAALEFGRDYDRSKPFYEQYKALLNSVPRVGLVNNKAENSDYCNFSDANKNCYLLFSANYNEDCYYGTMIVNNKNCIDTLWAVKDEFCYECIYCEKCNKLAYSSYSQQCYDSYFLYNCHNCSNCIGCTNLRNKSWHIFNKPVTKKEYENFLASFKGIHSKTEKIKQQFAQVLACTPRLYLVGKNNNNVSGDNIFNCNNVHGSYDIYDSSDSKYCYDGIHVKDSYDSHSLDGIELCYETTSTIGYHYLFTIACRDSNDITCCDSCFNCKDLFGCIGLKHNKYCILNKQYSKEQYEKLVPEIVENMIKTKEWGEFFPAGLSPFCYNETEADTYYPMPREKALQTGFKWKEEDAMNRYQGPKIRLPDNIAEVNDDITKQILCCESCSKNYRIIIQELDFYRRVKLPVPHKCPDCRHKERLTKRNPRKLWDRKCAKCGAEIQTTFEPDHPETVYCEQCYLKEIY